MLRKMILCLTIVSLFLVATSADAGIFSRGRYRSYNYPTPTYYSSGYGYYAPETMYRSYGGTVYYQSDGWEMCPPITVTDEVVPGTVQTPLEVIPTPEGNPIPEANPIPEQSSPLPTEQPEIPIPTTESENPFPAMQYDDLFPPLSPEELNPIVPEEIQDLPDAPQFPSVLDASL